MFKVLELVKYMWIFYKDRIIQNYGALFPDIEKSVVLGSVLGKLMTACLKSCNLVLIWWWVDTEGTKYFDMTAVKTHMRCLNIKIPRNWGEL
jgi:hypothetical protein